MNERKKDTVGSLQREMRVLKRAIKREERIRKLSQERSDLLMKLQDLRDFNVGKIDSFGLGFGR